MSKFRKKPIVIEASQWFKNGDHPDDHKSEQTGFQNGRLVSVPASHRLAHNWEGEVVRYFRHPEVDPVRACEHCGNRMHVHGWIDTLEGGHIVCPGDWIITGVAGEVYPCKPAIFEASYEPGQAPQADDTALLRQALDALTELMPPKDDLNHGGHDARDVRNWQNTVASLRARLDGAPKRPA